eukprot:snap_masked-scaffold_8-processed-gene-11.6-mRNA-1 protein AED:0.06 eAED:0.06 QI:0/-1/0/1/-1/1/1/0/88
MVKTEIKEEVKKETGKNGSQIGAIKFKVGQKRETPPPASGSRVFYESLYKENPKSFMALKWVVEHGVLPEDQCKAAVKQLEKMKLKQK